MISDSESDFRFSLKSKMMAMGPCFLKIQSEIGTFLTKVLHWRKKKSLQVNLKWIAVNFCEMSDKRGQDNFANKLTMHVGEIVVSEAEEVPGERGELEDLVELESKMAANILFGQRNKQGEI